MKKIFPLLLAIIPFFSCRKEDNEILTLKYSQTYCQDPWSNGSGDSETLANVRSYLNLRGLYYSTVDIKQEATAEACKACSCKSGKMIYVTTKKSQKSDFLSMGFTQ